MGELLHKHSAFVQGGRRFGEQLADLEGVYKVITGRFEPRGSSCRRVVIQQTKSSIKVTLSVSDGHQDFFAVPQKGVELDTLMRTISAHLASRNIPMQTRGSASPETW